jgi:hypothetical protein
LRRWAAHDDPLVAAAGLLGLILAGNQPFYPLYVHLITGGGAGPASVVLAGVPLFLAVPWLGRRHKLAARVLLPLAGIGNTLLAARVLGPAAGLDYLLIPCAGLAMVLFRRTERLVMLGVVAAAIAAWLLADMGGPSLFDAAGYAGLRRMNAISALALCGLVGWLVPAGPGVDP